MPKAFPDEPEEFGFQSDGGYAPSPAEIRRECAKIRAGWSERERISRAAWAQPVRVVLEEQRAESAG